MKLFEPITIRSMTLKNRILMSSMGLGHGYTNRRVRNFYVARAKGGVGAISIGAGIPGLFYSDDAWGRTGAVKKLITRLKSFTQAVQDAGAKIGIQFFHGNQFPMTLNPKIGELVAPSPRIEPAPSRSPWVDAGAALRELTIAEIESIVGGFGEAAAGARAAGFDFVEIHNAHGMLPCQFFSPISNQREDVYGGDLERRMRFSTDCARAMRKAVGEDFPLFARQGGMDIASGGFGLEDGIVFAKAMVASGIDVLNVSIGTPLFQGGYVPGGEDPEGTHVHLAAAVKAHVNVPVVAVGRIKDPAVAESILTRGDADIVAIGRQLIADPSWPRKARSGRTDAIIPCIDCHECYKRSTAENGVECTSNYSVSREGELGPPVAIAPKRVLVVGGGPAGMEAARVAAARGHRVTLVEKGCQLGGALLLQAMIPAKQPVDRLTRYLTRQVKAAGVTVRLHRKAAPAEIGRYRPDAVVLAPGAIPVMPSIPGIDRENVISGGLLREMMGGVLPKGTTIRRGWRGVLVRLGAMFLRLPWNLPARNLLAAIGIPIIFQKRVVIMGGDLTACQLADFLSSKRREVTIAAMESELASDLPSTLQQRLLRRLDGKGVTIEKGVAKFNRITASGLVIVDRRGHRKTLCADTVMPMLARDAAAWPDSGLTPAACGVFVAGDCAAPFKLLHAVHDGARVGREI
ncbi:FAD-dependent oxidoreductase [uncultured Desulfosarcina sp.]|uniref:oxidoreductase n=1 Tax=uncultured Desulfosarcina sp. TaxID=218289 RepID=UPI0029C8B76F|nr:FAD-dependent oxidoreductase [uncultured Desulfosarcina sp.]